jgi:cell division transport system ATP-binding protein
MINPSAMIVFDRVTKRYGKDVVAVEDVTLSIEKGEFVSIVGKSGAGKSTLLKLLIGEERPTEGKVFFRSTDIGELKSSELPYHRRRIGMVFQDFRLLEGRTVAENIAFAMEVVGKSKKEIREVIPQALRLVGLTEHAQRFPKELSGGEKQRVAIARALVHDPDCIVADEPTGNLDPVTAWDIIRLLARINEMAGTAVVLATHDKDIVNAIRRRVILMEGGRLIRDDPEGRYAL